jgi:hypothetical protein
MVEKMRSAESRVSRAKGKSLATDLRLPVFDEPLIEPWPLNMSWEDAMRSFAPFREDYMRRFDSPEKRLRQKNPARFSLR